MLKATINIDDLVRTPRIHSGGIQVEGSDITPFPNPCLRTVFVQGKDRWIYAVLERGAQKLDDRLPTVHDARSFEDYASIHRTILSWPLDYVLIEAVSNGENAQLRITSGRLGVAPLYATVGVGRVLLSWDCADLISRGSHSADFEVLAHALGLRTFYASRQVCTGIALLTERSSLSLDANSASFAYPSAAPALSPHALRDGVDALGTFESYLEGAIGARPLDASACIAELSGGMDSASVAIAAARVLGGLKQSAGIVLAGTDHTIQNTRRRLIAREIGLRDASFDMSTHMPSLDLDPSAREPEHPLGEFYLEAFDEIWRHAATLGCHTLLTGIGGDELFPRYQTDKAAGDWKRPARLIAAERIARSILSRRAQVALDTEPLYCAPASVVPHTGLLAHASRSPYMLRRGLWPVNPLCDPALIGFCHRLPGEFRLDRQLLRQYLRTRLEHDLFPIGYKKETFDYVLPEVIGCHYARLSAQLRESALADFGLVDMTAVRKVLSGVADTRDVTATAPLAIFLFLERFMRQIA
ncbi:Asparagine synthase [Cupriavidus necator]|uniref:Asparagine synthase n=1 Tax=Cupriavidus necator (strain ATCC 17699 / DSM 428 / KCTC 22496 / NCIMB 10442 / H16 / Stanier 337) TaxID=381666 RepID=Q0K6S3_CUPNH|nr:hypothetical protein [Cupriavidus necator]QCC02053.1 hypothetical protein E6A55_16415 [Cupriavidus necator H16]QQB75113.1 hypothetical protein I6H87_09735 [Cupriavidus necator]WKA40459.1 hypothetical protein QWP09_16445 [Cupriavidus necator]CAJ94298.1 Hypothetical protein H16_A3223 [Cupriavidus necator H16]